MFLKVTVTKSRSPENVLDTFNGLRVRFRMSDVKIYQELDKNTTRIILDDGWQYYCSESLEELDVLVDGASAKAAKILYGNKD